MSHLPQYRFSAVLSGHSSDVRCLSTMSASPASSLALVSGSRDLKTKLWRTTPESKDREWVEEMTFKADQRYISAVATMEPNYDFKEGLIYTGSMSGAIRAFTPSSAEPIFELEEAHSQCVSALFVSQASGTLLSGSWDHTAKVWVDRLKPVMTLSGHENSVWAVIILTQSGIMVTGSADKSLRLWKAGVCKGLVHDAHEQAIRDICVVKADSFLSSGNDGAVKLWTVDVNSVVAMLVKTIPAHSHFIYTICPIIGETDAFVAAGENSGVKIFRGGEEMQVLPVPAISVWNVVPFSNGDIAASCSDGKIWLFSSDPRRFAEADLNALYELELSKFKRPAKTELEGVNTADLPGPNVLLAPGRRDGQTKMVKDDGVISVHSWSHAEQKWTKIGDVVGQPGEETNGAAPDGGKVVFEGVEYDFVFDIELDTGGKLKLPHNRTDDVWHSAQKFIHKHELPQSHLETIANFLTKNGGGHVRPSTEINGGVWDPLTGGNAYTTSGESAPMEVDNSHFPQTQFLTFSTQPKYAALTEKLKAFNAQVSVEKRLADERLERLPQLCLPSTKVDHEDVQSLVTVLHWPQEKTFPGLDILRLAVINANVSSILTEDNHLENVIDILKENVKPGCTDTCQMLALRGLANLFALIEGKKLLLKKREDVLAMVTSIVPKDNKNTEIALSTLVLNYSVAVCESDDAMGQAQCVTTICMLFLEDIADIEAKYRILVALGTLLHHSKTNVTLAKDLQINTALLTWKLLAAEVPNYKKVEECAGFILRFW